VALFWALLLVIFTRTYFEEFPIFLNFLESNGSNFPIIFSCLGESLSSTLDIVSESFQGLCTPKCLYGTVVNRFIKILCSHSAIESYNVMWYVVCGTLMIILHSRQSAPTIVHTVSLRDYYHLPVVQVLLFNR
jgi:hypothetical protein